jgi:hypothetical protein
MKRYKSYIIKVIILSHFCILVGCVDEAILPSETVDGKIYDDNDIVINYLVSSGNYPIISTDVENNFKLEIQTSPFDLVVAENTFFGIYETAKFLNVTNKTSHIIMKEWAFPKDYFSDYCGVRVYFPKFAELNFVFIKFISKDHFIDDTPFYTSASDYQNQNSEYYLDKFLYLPRNKNSIEGKIYYFEALIDNNTGNIVACERFGIKDITLFKGSNEPVRFNEAELSYNPPEKKVPASINFPAGYGISGAAISVSLPGYSKSSDFVLYNYFGNNTEIIIPILPSPELKIKVSAEYVAPNYGYYGGESAEYFESGEAMDLNHEEHVTITSPLNGDENITDTTTFEINDNSTDIGIYEFFLYSSNRIMSIFTDKKSIKFSDFRAWGHPLSANTYYLWMVRKYPEYSSVDDLLSMPYVINSKHRYIELSRDARFKTAPNI